MNRVVTTTLAVILLVLAASFAYNYSQKRPSPLPTKSQDQLSTEENVQEPELCPASESMETFGSFTIKCPEGYYVSQGPLTYSSAPEGFVWQLQSGLSEPWTMSIITTPTKEKTTESWLAAQPQGNDNKAGIKFTQWVDAGPHRWAVYTVYSQIDTDNGKPILGKGTSAAYVADGKLYQAYKNETFSAPTALFLEVLKSFRIS